ncbi:hypothetical protein [Nocardiopsis sp. YSL2]|uniref:hypothetical protein n=1 Tax=Nocardiopsis sp. YSL2 TaxID=2939492 RepID=UPI0026F444F0|nr:hypothetical protein [Nocardiopsis sp. YSL2]
MTVHTLHPAPRVILVNAGAADRYTDTWSDPDLRCEIGPQLSCAEADDLAEILTELGAPEAGHAWLLAHARADDEGDRHDHLREEGIREYGE